MTEPLEEPEKSRQRIRKLENDLRSLRDDRIKLQGLLEYADDAIISVDENQRIRLLNPAAPRIFGYAEEEILGQPLKVLMPAYSRELHTHRVREFMKSPDVGRMMGERIALRSRFLRENAADPRRAQESQREPCRGDLQEGRRDGHQCPHVVERWSLRGQVTVPKTGFSIFGTRERASCRRIASGGHTIRRRKESCGAGVCPRYQSREAGQHHGRRPRARPACVARRMCRQTWTPTVLCIFDGCPYFC
jgi:PAS domain S-box-containing protein